MTVRSQPSHHAEWYRVDKCRNLKYQEVAADCPSMTRPFHRPDLIARDLAIAPGSGQTRVPDAPASRLEPGTTDRGHVPSAKQFRSAVGEEAS